MKYYAKIIQDGIEIEIGCNPGGYLEINTIDKITSLDTNAIDIIVWDNDLSELHAPNAKSVSLMYCKLKKLVLPEATYIDCYSNNIKYIDAPKSEFISACENIELYSIKSNDETEIICYNNIEVYRDLNKHN